MISNPVVIEAEGRKEQRDPHGDVKDGEVLGRYDSGFSEQDPGSDHDRHDGIIPDIKK